MKVLNKLLLIIGLNIFSEPCLGSLRPSFQIVPSLKTTIDNIASAANAHSKSIIPEELSINEQKNPSNYTGLISSRAGETTYNHPGVISSRIGGTTDTGFPGNHPKLIPSRLDPTEDKTENRGLHNDNRGINFNPNTRVTYPNFTQVNYTQRPPQINLTNHRGISPDHDHPHLPLDKETSLFVFNTSYKDKNEGKILNPFKPATGGSSIPKVSPSSPNGLCDFCLCSTNMSIIFCLHKHSESNKHIMVLDSAIIPKKVQTLQIKGYESIEIRPHALASNPDLKEVVFEDITNLILVSNSLYFSPESSENRKVSLKFKNCIIPKFPEDALTQNVEGRHNNKDILNNERRRYLSIEFVGCKILAMEKHSLRRARIYSFYLLRTRIKSIVSHAIDLDVNYLVKFESSILPSLPTKAICLHSMTIIFLSNRIQRMDNRSIVIETDSTVLFENNEFDDLRFGALAGIGTSNKRLGASVDFINNQIKRIEPKAMVFGQSFRKQTVENNTFHIPCDCGIATLFEGLWSTTVDETPSFKIALRSSYCIDNATEMFILVDNYLTEECAPFPIVTVTAVCVAILLFIVAVTVCVVCSLRVQQVKEEANMLGECTSQSFSTLSRNYPDTTLRTPCDENNTAPFAVLPWGVAFPEIKTYQLHQTPEFTEQTESICGSTRGSMKDRRSELFGRNADRASCPFN